MRSPVTEPLHQLADAWVSVTRAPRRRAALAVAALACAAALLLARGGTLRARLGAGGAACVSVILAVGWEVMGRRRLHEPTRVLGGPARQVDPVRVDRALRALSLVGPSGEILDGGTSTDLARLHVARALSDIPSGQIMERGAQRAARVSAAAALVGLCLAGVIVTHPWSLLEGADVMFARHGVAPVAMQWLDGIGLTARPPEYLHEGEVHEITMTALALPFGTAITLGGQPLHPGRRLLLSDGSSEVPFVEDGAGGVVARWVLAQSTSLRVVARFGGVVIAQSDTLDIASIADEAPVVRLDGAPRRFRLVDETEDIALKYEASDDHGLREVQM
ncbi:MAG TPA: DUF4175 family protein, partial [Gemmatimonadales bacterium]|nr:DUF4175 family protein [Gemmatimonadales bacterium]